MIRTRSVGFAPGAPHPSGRAGARVLLSAFWIAPVGPTSRRCHSLSRLSPFVARAEGMPRLVALSALTQQVGPRRTLEPVDSGDKRGHEVTSPRQRCAACDYLPATGQTTSVRVTPATESPSRPPRFLVRSRPPRVRPSPTRHIGIGSLYRLHPASISACAYHSRARTTL